MAANLSRREFIKISQLLPLLYFAPPAQKSKWLLQEINRQNILVLVFDAWSANHIQLYGYPRRTMPKLTAFAEKSTVFHNHYSAGNFTSPGTASLLTGTMPWTHRAFNLHSLVDEAFEAKNIFTLFDDYYRTAYSHNPLANAILKQFLNDIDHYKPRQELFLDDQLILTHVFGNDYDIASLSWVRIIKELEGGYTNSLFLSEIYKRYKEKQVEYYKDLYPRGVPHLQKDNYFFFDHAIDWSMNWTASLSQPFLGYFHYYPPHAPFSARKEFVNAFENDGYDAVRKKEFFLMNRNIRKTEDEIIEKRQWYDEYLLFVDSELDRMLTYLENKGVLENTWVVITSDHGEMFERGFVGHVNGALFQDVVKIPLLIRPPGQDTRINVYENTSSLDVLPTLLHLMDRPIPEWLEGEVLPPYAEKETDQDRSIYSLEARNNEKYGPLTEATASLIKGKYKLIYYFGYDQLRDGAPLFELFDLDQDPEEINNIFEREKSVAQALQFELFEKLNEVNRPYLDG